MIPSERMELWTMRAHKKRWNSRYFLFLLLFVLIFYELHFVGENARNKEAEAPLSDRAVLCSVGTGFLCPVRPHEKITLRVDQHSTWERSAKKDLKLLKLLFALFPLCSFFLAICISLLYLCLESSNLPFRRVINYIHRKDGKGPEELTFS